jgi:hypothetical protein
LLVSQDGIRPYVLLDEQGDALVGCSAIVGRGEKSDRRKGENLVKIRVNTGLSGIWSEF